MGIWTFGNCKQDVLETMGQFMDGLRFSGGSFSLMPHDIVRQLTRLAHNHDVYVSSGGWADHVLAQGPSVFRQYVQVGSYPSLI